jgi:hypothetical protein
MSGALEQFVAQTAASIPGFSLPVPAAPVAPNQSVEASRQAAASANYVEPPHVKIAKFDAEQRKAGKQLTPESKARNDAFTDQLAFATALETRLDKNGRCSSEMMNRCAPLLSGYKLPEGITVNAQACYAMLAVARKAGFSQQHVDAYLKAEMEMFG